MSGIINAMEEKKTALGYQEGAGDTSVRKGSVGI